MQGCYVLENKRGEVVRTLQWKGPKLSLVYLNKTGRVGSFDSVADLDENEISYTLLAEVTQEEIQRKPIKIADVGYLKWRAEEISTLSPSVIPEEDSSEGYFKALKWAAIAQVAFLILVFLIAHFAKPPGKTMDEQRLVTVVPRAPVMEPITHKRKYIQPHVAQHKVRRHVAPKVAQLKPVTKSKSRDVSLNHLGALSVLGSLNKSNSRDGGLKLNNVKTSRGPGLGGTAGSGGVQTSIYGKGLISAALGPEAKANGAGGYGHRGSGGGSAGYGRLSLVGSSSAYFQPVETEAEVEGGLDRAQIAEVIRRHLGQIRFCYENGLQVAPSLAGRVAVKFFIGGTGIVSTAQVANTSLHSNNVESCIVSHLKSWKFPEPRGGVIVKVNYPFVLKRVSQT